MKEPSYKKVNYLLRLRKQIERKIIMEVFQKLNKYHDLPIPLNEYCYFGLGSIYFADFILFHKYLHINDMISIDKGEEEKDGGRVRFLFNRPYDFINFEIMTSTDLLTKDKYDELNWSWNKNLIIWLDYDDPLSVNTAEKYVIPDFTTIGKKAKDYDIFITTLECWDGAEETKDAIEDEKICQYLSLPGDFISNSENLQPENSPVILNNFIRGCFREGFRKFKRHDMDFTQLFHFAYKDTAPMYTFGCIFIPKNEKRKFQDFCNKSEIKFYVENDEPEKIDCPILTPHERYFIDSCIGKQKDRITCNWRAEQQTGLRREEIERYVRYYKYYPQFFEAIY